MSLARWRSGNAVVCKTSMHGFDSRPGLKIRKALFLQGFSYFEARGHSLPGLSWFRDNLFKTSHKSKKHQKDLVLFCFVGERGLEPPRIAPLVPKTNAYTISPLALEDLHNTYFLKRI
jgi:hypothetical protein